MPSALAGPSDVFSGVLVQQQPHAPSRSSSLRHSLLPPPPTPPTPPSKRTTNRTSSTPRRVGSHGALLSQPAVPDALCAFCTGSTLNKHQKKEMLVACYECGSAGHPTCLGWEDMTIVKKVLKYPWMCQDCKRCEVCDTKEDDDDMLLCDSCDRGWHRPCLTPPLLAVPRGKWTCPTCTQNVFTSAAPLPLKRARQASSPELRDVDFDRTTASSHKGKERASDTPNGGSGSVRLTLKLPPPGLEESLEEEEYLPSPGGSQSGRRARKPSRKQQLGADGSFSFSPGSGGGRERDRDRERGEPKIPYHILQQQQREAEEAAARALDGSEEDESEEDDEEPYGGYLDEEQRQVGDRKPEKKDRERWEEAKNAVEQKALLDLQAASQALIVPSPTPSGGPPTPGGPSSSVRSTRYDSSAALPLPSSGISTPRASTPTLPLTLPIGSITTILFGEYAITTWYQAPFPDEFSRVPDGKLWICEFCLKYMKGGFTAERHRLKCKMRHPPGDEIYRDGKVSVWEVDGRKSKIYCQNLCLLAKMFLDHKTLYYDVEPFLFYVMTLSEVTGAKFVGYFSKEKRSPTNNVSCIMTLPVRQRQGWGNLLIDFSYLLSKREGRTGTPERPLSDLGLLSYRSYWTLIIYQYLAESLSPSAVTIDDISAKTAITPDDIYYVLDYRKLIVDLSALPPSPPPAELAAPSPPPASTSTSLLIDSENAEPQPAESVPAAPTPTSSRPHRNQWTTRKSRSHASQPLGTALLAGSSSRNPHIDDHGSSEPPPIPEKYTLVVDVEEVRAVVEKWRAKGWRELKPEGLQWSPFLVQRGGEETKEKVKKDGGSGSGTMEESSFSASASASGSMTPAVVGEDGGQQPVASGSGETSVEKAAGLNGVATDAANSVVAGSEGTLTPLTELPPTPTFSPDLNGDVGMAEARLSASSIANGLVAAAPSPPPACLSNTPDEEENGSHSPVPHPPSRSESEYSEASPEPQPTPPKSHESGSRRSSRKRPDAPSPPPSISRNTRRRTAAPVPPTEHPPPSDGAGRDRSFSRRLSRGREVQGPFSLPASTAAFHGGPTVEAISADSRSSPSRITRKSSIAAALNGSAGPPSPASCHPREGSAAVSVTGEGEIARPNGHSLQDGERSSSLSDVLSDRMVEKEDSHVAETDEADDDVDAEGEDDDV